MSQRDPIQTYKQKFYQNPKPQEKQEEVNERFRFLLLGANDDDVGVNPRFGGGADAACGLADALGGHPVWRYDGGGGGGGGEGEREESEEKWKRIYSSGNSK